MTKQEFEALVARNCAEIQSAARQLDSAPAVVPRMPVMPAQPAMTGLGGLTSGVTNLLGSVGQWAQIISAIRAQR